MLARAALSRLIVPVAAGLCLAASCEDRARPAAAPRPAAEEAPPVSPKNIFPAQVAGRFYDDDPVALRAEIERYLEAARRSGAPRPEAGADLLGLVVPHAGYPYSGPVAAHAFAAARGRADIRRVVVLGPAHRRHYAVPALLDADAYRTPLGDIPIDRAGVAALAKSGAARVDRVAFEGEHALEVELPFLQVVLGAFELVPVMVSAPDPKAARALAAALKAAFPGRDTLVVASTDLSHDYPYEVAVAMDSLAAERVAALDVEGLLRADGAMRRAGEGIRVGAGGRPEPEACQLCGLGTVLTLLELARAYPGARGTLLDRRTSGDVVGDTRSRIVGYAALAVTLASPRPEASAEKPGLAAGGDFLSAEEKRELLRIARESLRRHFAAGEAGEFELQSPRLEEPGAAFVTLKKRGQLRGCIGHMEPTSPLWRMIRDRALDAALHDPRFQAVGAEELGELHLEISVLSPRIPVKDPLREIVIGRDGVWLELGAHRGVFLPQVPVEQGWDTVEEYLDNLCRKAGLPRGCWQRPEAVLMRFTALVFGEEG
jgi:hypothetical protein